jgi:hypothetical protein
MTHVTRCQRCVRFQHDSGEHCIAYLLATSVLRPKRHQISRMPRGFAVERRDAAIDFSDRTMSKAFISAERRRPRGKTFGPKQISRIVIDVVQIDEQGCRSSHVSTCGSWLRFISADSTLVSRTIKTGTAQVLARARGVPQCRYQDQSLEKAPQSQSLSLWQTTHL